MLVPGSGLQLGYDIRQRIGNLHIKDGGKEHVAAERATGANHRDLVSPDDGEDGSTSFRPTS